MSSLSTADKQYLDNALRLNVGGWIVHFTDEAFRKFFAESDIEIDDPKYAIHGTTQTDKLHAFFEIETNQAVGHVILEFAALFRNRELLLGPMNIKFSVELEKIGNKLLGMADRLRAPQPATVSIDNNFISIEIRPEIYEHIKTYLNNGDYFHAVDEAYKVVRNKLGEKTGKQKASDVFNMNAESNRYHDQLFGYTAESGSAKSDFLRGIGYIHLAVQFLRNEKSHSLADDLDKNVAIHYLALASLAYDLISRGEK